VHIEAQSIFNGSFTGIDNYWKKSSKTIELKDSMGESVFIYSRERLVYNYNEYNYIRNNNSIILIDSVRGARIGIIRKDLRSFSCGETTYKLSKKNRGGYNFSIIDEKSNLTALVKYRAVKNDFSIEVLNEGEKKLLPFIYFVTMGEIINYKESMNNTMSTVLANPLN